MNATSRRRKALLVALLALAGLAPGPALAGGHLVQVGKPGGVDDTARLQAALDRCVELGPGCTVQLAAGTYRTRQLVSTGFRGTLRGMGMGRTTVEALPGLPVPPEDRPGEEWCPPNTTDCPWPSLLIFLDSDAAVSDLRFLVPSVQATQPYVNGTTLIDILRAMGRERANLSVDRVAFEGVVDPDPAGFGYNVINGVFFVGALPRSPAPADYFTMGGALSVRSSVFRAMFDGVGMGGAVSGCSGVVGGSPRAGNTFRDVFLPIWLTFTEGCMVDVSHNVASGAGWYGFVLDPSYVAFSRPSLYFVHDNTFSGGAGPNRGIEIIDDPANPLVKALVFDNTLGAPGEETRFGVNLITTRGVQVIGNRIAGSGGIAVLLQESSKAAVLGNDVSGFTPVDQDLWSPPSQIVLDETTTDSLVACRTPEDTVLDLGTGDKVVRCKGP